MTAAWLPALVLAAATPGGGAATAAPAAPPPALTERELEAALNLELLELLPLLDRWELFSSYSLLAAPLEALPQEEGKDHEDPAP